MMTDTLKARLGDVELGDLPILNDARIEGGSDNPLGYPLAMSDANAEPKLAYRAVRPLHRENAIYEINLGSIIAASAVVFSVPLVAYPSTVSMLLLLSDESQAAAGADEELQIALVEPARDGNIDLARFVDLTDQKAFRETVGDEAVNLTPVDIAAEHMNALIRHAMQHQALIDISLPVPEQAVEGLKLKLPDQLEFDADGAFYFRDIMNGEADFLFDGQQDFSALTYEMTVRNGGFYLLEEDEEFIDLIERDPDSFTDLETSLTVSSDDGDLESVFSRLAIISNENAEEVMLDVEVFAGSTAILIESFIIRAPTVPIEDAQEQDRADLDTEYGLPKQEIYEEHEGLNAGSADPDIL